MAQLKPGDKAPSFTLSDQHGRPVRLEDFAGRRLFLYFYPKAGTSGCTAQAQAVREAIGPLDERRTAVVGISPDPEQVQRRFDDTHGLGFRLLSDPEHQAAAAYGVWAEKTLYGRSFMGVVRSAFLVAEDGRIAAVWYKISPKNTVPAVLKALAALDAGRRQAP